MDATLVDVAAGLQPSIPERDKSGDGSRVLSATRLRVIRQHKQGGLGLVSVALDESFNREVALKEIRPHYAHHQESRERFEREATITGQLEHPNIVPIYGMGNYADGRPFYAMRFIKGDSLKDAITAFHAMGDSRQNAGQYSLALRKLLGRFLDVCHAVAYAHNRHVLHRDLKPGNIMLGEYGETLVVDWGLAKRMDAPSNDDVVTGSSESAGEGEAGHKTREGSHVGTPAYMSPEQAAGAIDQLGVATDIYSLGATLYALLTDQPPIKEGSSQEILERVQRGDWPAPRKVKPSVPRALEAICLKAMALRPEDRYGSATALAQDIERYLAHEPTLVGGESLGERLGRWQRKNPGLSTGLAATMVILLLAVISLSWLAWELHAATRDKDLALQATNVALDRAERSANDARNAEQKTREESARREAIRLEQLADRGNWRTLLELVDGPVLRTYEDRVEYELLRLEALNALGRSKELKLAVESFSQRHGEGPHRGQVLLWQAEVNWTLLTGPAAATVREALRWKLPPEDQAYADALLAPTVPDAIALLYKSVNADPYHYRANRMLCADLIVSGLPEGKDRTRSQQYMFPDDPNYPFLLALAATFEQDKIAVALHSARLHAIASDDFAKNADRILAIVDGIVRAGGGEDGTSPAQLVLAIAPLVLTWNQLAASVENGSRDSAPELPPQLYRAPQKLGQGLLNWQSSGLLGGIFGNRRAQAIANVKEASEILPIAPFLTLYGKMLSMNGQREEALPVLEQAYRAPIVFPDARKYTLLYVAEQYALQFMSDPKSEAGKQAEGRVYELMEELLDLGDPPPFVIAACDQFLHLDDRTKLKAHQALERAHEKAPDDINLTSMLARSHLRQGNDSRALKLAETVLATNPDDQRAQEVRTETLKNSAGSSLEPQ